MGCESGKSRNVSSIRNILASTTSTRQTLHIGRKEEKERQLREKEKNMTKKEEEEDDDDLLPVTVTTTIIMHDALFLRS